VSVILYSMNKKYIFLLIAVVLFVVVAVLFINKQFGTDGNNATEEQAGIAGESIDIALDFYSSWLEALKSTTTNPYEQGLDTSAALSDDVKNYLKASKDSGITPDPVICQTDLPERISAKPVFKTEEKAQYIILARREQKSEQSLVTLEARTGGWLITEIGCSNGEVAPEKEFTFEKEGFLLKSVPPPLDSNYWHLVYKLDGVDGYTAQLFFDASSTCVATDGVESVCNPDNFDEPSKVFIKGQMTEAGAEVKRVEFIKG